MKRFTLLIAIAAIGAAVSVPAAAQAEGLITNANEEAAEKVEWVSENTVINTAGGQITCTTNRKVETNTGGGVYSGTAELSGTPLKTHVGHCGISASAIKVEFTSGSSEVELDGEGSGSVTYSFTYDIVLPGGGSIPCTLTSSSAGTVSYTPTSDEISVSASLSGSGDTGCPTSGTLTANYTALDENGEPAVIH